MVVNVTWVAFAIPIVAIAVVFLRPALRRRRTTPWPFLAIGVVGFVISTVMFALAGADVRVYRGAPSCRAELTLAQPLDGTCRVMSAIVQRTYRTSGRSANTHVILAFDRGAAANVVVARTRRGSVVRGFLDHDDRYATIQDFHNRVVLVQTQSGEFETNDLPERRVNTWGLTGISLGAVGVIAAFALALRGGYAA